MSLSFSQLSTYKHCPKHYEFAYVKKLPRQISKGESFGSSVHNTLKKWGELELQSKGGTPEDQLKLFMEEPVAKPQPLTIETLLTLWHQSFIVEGFESRLDADFGRKRGEPMMEQYFTWWSKEPRDLLLVEKGFAVTINNETITGRFDRLENTEGGIRVIDYKTSRPRTQEQVDADLQLSIYAHAVEQSFGKVCTELVLLFLREEEGLLEVKTTRNASQLKDAFRQIGMMESQIASGDYHPDPSVEKCRVCPYRSVCPSSAYRG